jgi:hypothetical protein
MNHLMQDANTTYTEERIRAEFRARMSGCDMDFDACTNIAHVNKKRDAVQKTIHKSWVFLGSPHHPDKGGNGYIFQLYTKVRDELQKRVDDEADRGVAVHHPIEKRLIEIITIVENDVAMDKRMEEEEESLSHARSFKDRLISDLLVTDDAPIPETAFVALHESSKLTVGCGNHAAEKEARKEERRRKFAEEQERKRQRNSRNKTKMGAEPKKEVSAPATGTAEQEDVATIPDTSLPPNTAALDIFNGIVCDLNNGTLKVPMNGDKEYSPDTFSRNVAPIRSFLENKFNDVPVSSSETDLEHILDNVATRTDIPKTDNAQLNKLPTAAKWFLKVLRSNKCDDSPVAPCDTTMSPPVEETIEIDATPMSSLQEDAPDTPPAQEDASDAPPVQEDAPPPPDAPPVQEDAPPPPDAPQQSILVKDKKRASRKNSKAKKRTKEQDVESTTVEITRPVKMQKSNTLKNNTDTVLGELRRGTMTLTNTKTGKELARGTIEKYYGQVQNLLDGGVIGITIEPNETNPFRVLENTLTTHMDAIREHDKSCSKQLSCGMTSILKLHKQFPQFEF